MQRTKSRRLVLSGSLLEPEIGFARAVQVGAPVAPDIRSCPEVPAAEDAIAVVVV